MFSQQLAKFKIETKIKTSLRARGPPGVSGALSSVRILRIGRIGSGSRGLYVLSLSPGKSPDWLLLTVAVLHFKYVFIIRDVCVQSDERR